MPRQGNDDPSVSHPDPSEGGDDEDPTSQQPTADAELGMYEDDEVATAPWVPPS